MEGLGVILFIGFIALLVWAAANSRAARQKLEQELATALGGQVTETGVRGKSGAIDVEIKFTTRGTGSNAVRWAYYEAALPAGYPLTLYLRPHEWRDHHHVASGTMVDVVVGEAVFDDKFLVEGAPEAVIRALFDADVRAGLIAEAGALDVGTEGTILRFAVRGWPSSVAEAMPRVGLVAGIAGRVREATLALDDATPLRSDGDAYRAIPDDRPLQAARAQRVAEVDRVKALRPARDATAIGIGFLVAIVFLFLLAAGR